MNSRTCPRCGRNDVRPSARRGFGDVLLVCFGLVPYRCRNCRHRYFRLATARPDSNALLVEPLADQPMRIRPVVEHALAAVPLARSILIVSGDPALRKLLCKVLGRHRYHTHELADASLLTSELRARKVDLLIADLDLPDRQVVDRLRTLRSAFPNLKIIALSALYDAEVPGSVVLPKPFHREMLLQSVQDAFIGTTLVCQSSVSSLVTGSR